MIMVCIIPLLILRYMHHRILLGKMPKLTLKRKFSHRWLRKFWLVANIDCLFYPLVAYEVYLIFGPWFIGEVMDGYIGAIFAWGIIVNGVYIPGLFTYVYGFIQMFLCQFPLTFILACCADERFVSKFFLWICFFFVILIINFLFSDSICMLWEENLLIIFL